MPEGQDQFMGGFAQWLIEVAPMPRDSWNAGTIQLVGKRLASCEGAWPEDTIKTVQQKLALQLKWTHPEYQSAVRTVKAHWLSIMQAGSSNVTGLPSWAEPVLERSEKYARTLGQAARLNYRIYQKYYDAFIKEALDKADI